MLDRWPSRAALGARPPRAPPHSRLAVACVTTTMLLIAPLARKAHIVVLLLPSPTA